MKRNAIILIVMILLVAGMIYLGARISRNQKVGLEPPEAPQVAAGNPAPEFELKTLDGKTAKLSDYKGKAVLLNFWATWCEPCKIEMPWLVEYNKQYGPQGFTVLGVAMDDDADSKAWVQKDIRKFSDEMKVNYPVLLGTSKIGDTYGGVPFLPEIFYIGRDGKIVEHAIGLKGKGEIEENIKKIL
ncbi:MAG: TlpA family protein disulfide reductase [Terriglobales bacterium]